MIAETEVMEDGEERVDLPKELVDEVKAAFPGKGEQELHVYMDRRWKARLRTMIDVFRDEDREGTFVMNDEQKSALEKLIPFVF